MMQKMKKLFLLFVLASVLVACSNSNEKQMIGEWKVVEEREVVAFLEVTKDHLTIRSPYDRESMTFDYYVKDTVDDQFLIDVQSRDSSENEFLFEGYFKTKDKIKVVEVPSGKTDDSEIIRVENVAEERNKIVEELEEEEKRERAREERRAKKEEKEREEEVVMLEGEEIYQQSCASCHGADLSGSAGPMLMDVSEYLSAGEIKDIILNGKGAMPGGLLVDEEEIRVLVEWLLEQSS